MEHIQFIMEDHARHRLGIGNVLKGLITSLSINDDTVIRCYDDYIYGNYDTILDDKFIFKGTTNKILEKVNTCRFLILFNEDDCQPDLPNEYPRMDGLENPRFDNYFSHTKRIDWYYDTDLIANRVKHRIFESIDKIIFKDIVTSSVKQMVDTFIHQVSLGISIRTWKADHESNIDRAYDVDIYKNKFIEVLEKHPDITTIVLSIDNIEYIQPYIDLCNDRRLSYILLTKKAELNDIQHAIVKALILSNCNYFIGNRISTFSELVFWFGKHKTKVYPVF